MPLVVLALVALLSCSSQQQPDHPEPVPTRPPPPAPAVDAPPEPADAVPTAEVRAQVLPEINERFLDPKLDYDRWKKNFEGESREVYASRKEVIAALKIQPGQSVADIGAGTGFYLWEFASAVGAKGNVYGVEISPGFLDRLRKHVTNNKLANATIVTGTEKSVELPEDSVDLVFVCDTYHHFAYPKTTLASIRKALRSGGTLAIIDFKRIEGETAKWIMGHVRAGQEVFRAEIEAAGFELIEEPEIAGFKENYMMRFRLTE